MAETPQDFYDILKYLHADANTQFNEQRGFIRIWKQYGRDNPSVPRIVWGQDNTYNSLEFDGHSVSISMLSRFVQTLISRAEDEMEKLLLGANVPCLGNPVDMRQTRHVDSLSNICPGYSFVTDPSNATLNSRETSGYVLRQIFSSTRLKQEFFGVNGNTPNTIRLSSWLSQSGKFVELLLILIHLTAGQPTRATEILSASIINNDRGGVRSIYWVHQTIMLVQYYSKTSGRFGDKFVARFLPKKVAHLVVLYLAVIRPFER